MTGTGCDRVRGRLERLVDGDLAPLDAARDHGHLEACGACAREFEALRKLLGSIRALHAVPAEELRFAGEGLAERLGGVAPGRPRFRLLRGRVARAAATAAAGFLALFALQLCGAGLDDLGTMPGWTSRLLDHTHLEMPVWSEVLSDFLQGGDS